MPDDHEAVRRRLSRLFPDPAPDRPRGVPPHPSGNGPDPASAYALTGGPGLRPGHPPTGAPDLGTDDQPPSWPDLAPLYPSAGGPHLAPGHPYRGDPALAPGPSGQAVAAQLPGSGLDHAIAAPSPGSGLGDAYVAASRAGERGLVPSYVRAPLALGGARPALGRDRFAPVPDEDDPGEDLFGGESAAADRGPAPEGPPLDASSSLLGPGPFDPGRRGVKALAVVAAAVVVIAAGWAWWARPRAEPLPAPVVAATGDTATEPGSAGPAAEGEVVVAVTGKVRRPGLVRLPAGSRVADAVEAAGGILPGADLTTLNLARKVTDGELIAVGIEIAAEGGGSGPAATGGKVNINSANLTQLQSLPGIGPVLAQAILDHRAKHGPFGSVGDLRQVSGIGDTRYEQLKDLVTV